MRAQPHEAQQAGLPAAARGANHLQRSNQLLATAPAAALAQGEEAVRLAAGMGGRPLADAHVAAGTASQALRHYEAALQHFRVALALYQRQHDGLATAATWHYLGSAQYSQGDTGQARLSYQRAVQRFQRLGDLTGAARVYEHLGELYGSEGCWTQALKSQEQALAAWRRLGNKNGVVTALNNIGLVHHWQHHFSLALYYLHQASDSAQHLRDSTCLGKTLISMGRVYQDVGNQEVARQFYERAWHSLPRAAPPGEQALLLRDLATTQDSLGDRPAATAGLLQAVPLARRGGSQELLSGIYQALASVYQRDQKYALALEALQHADRLRDSVFAEQRSAQVAELRTRYETEKKEQQIQLLTKDRQIQQARLRRQQLVRNGLLAGTLLLLLLVAALYRARRQQTRINRLLRRKNVAISRQKEELAQLNQTKDLLFSVISHDLRSPLSSLYSLLTLVSLGTMTPERAATQSEHLRRTLDSTLLLLDNLLNWSAAQMKGSRSRPEQLRLDELVEEAQALLLSDADRKHITLRNELRQPYLAFADLNMIRLVLRNLLSNAIKFTPEFGTVTVAATGQAGRWEVSVTDTGVGIAAADRTKVFGASGPHSTKGTAHERGTGLGLRLCKEFVERNGGQLTFDSMPGLGTTFRFTLPALKAEPTPAPEQVPSVAAAAE